MKWERKTISDLCEIKGGKRLPKNHELIEVETNHPYIRARDIGNGIIDFSKPVYLQESTFNIISRYIVKEDDIVLTIVGANIGDVGLIPKELDGANLTENAVKLTLFNENCHFKYLLYYFLLPGKKEQLEQVAAGSAQGKLGLYKIKDIEVPIPPLATQRRIASILSAYDDLIENNLKRIKLLEEKAFLMYKGIVRSEKMEEFAIEDLADVVMGQSPTSDTYTTEKEDNLPFHQGVTNFSNYFIEHKFYCKAPIKIAEEGDILFSVRAPVGRINFTNDKICIGRGLCAFRSKKGFQNYFYHQLKEFFFAEDVIGNGAIFNAVTKVELMKVKLKTPNEKIQKEFEVEAQQIYNLILNLTKQNTKLREARDILLPRLMSGQIEV